MNSPVKKFNNPSSHPLETPVQFLKGVGPYVGGLLEKMGLQTVADLFYHFPQRYLDRRTILPIRKLQEGPHQCVVGEVVGAGKRLLGRSNKRIYEIVITDGAALATLAWFHFNEKYLQKKYPAGKKIFISGTCQIYGGKKQFLHPDIQDWDEESSASVVPLYPLTEGLHQKTIRKIIVNAIENYLPHLEETPFSVRATGEIKLTLREAIEKIHQPPNDSNITQLDNFDTLWHHRVIYDELFFLQLGLLLKKQGYKKDEAFPLKTSQSLKKKMDSLLPFELTQAQLRSIDEIEKDLDKPFPMNRLLQGDVGSGKTLVAFYSALTPIENGFQVALMVPTEILAEQHFKNLNAYGNRLGLTTALLTSSTPKVQRDETLKLLNEGKIHLLIGTHALIQEDVDYNNLGLIIIDEQHRFGVRQRAALKKKNKGHTTPHILVMTATPIPRTMAMSAYGDLDVSVIDQRPQGRIPIVTKVFNEKQRFQMYDLVLSQIKEGRQAYFIYPLVEESEKIDLKDAESMAQELSGVFTDRKISLLHGRMKGSEKEKIMSEFKAGLSDILVSTTVVEVGVDVPNASVMVIEHAERFGLSQLHQLRGRVGRGAHQSFCFLVAGYAQSEEGRFRLKVMEETDDGFKIAEEDLKLRGPGDFLGTRQSGLPELRLVNFAKHQQLLQAARKRALEIVEEDPHLMKPESQLLKRILKIRWEEKLDLSQVS